MYNCWTKKLGKKLLYTINNKGIINDTLIHVNKSSNDE